MRSVDAANENKKARVAFRFLLMFLQKLRSFSNRKIIVRQNEIIFARSFSQNDLKQLTLCHENKNSVCDSHSRFLFFHDGFRDENEKTQIINDMKMLDEFVSEAEELSLMKELEPHLKRLRYEKNHWDNAIKGYRETEKSSWNPFNREILEKVKQKAFSGSEALEHVHVLDLEENGVIMPHIDNVRFCGTTIAGISLLTDSVMRFVNERHKDKIFDVLLKRRSLYIMTGSVRYDYTHEILGNDKSMFYKQVITKGRRVSIICRNKS